MTTFTPHISSRSALAAAFVPVLILILVVALTLRQAPTSAASSAPRSTGSYAWPVKPFDAVHPVRSNFGDPRTSFDAPATVAGLMTSGGLFSFHFGIDISVPDGTAVYPVHSGTARLLGTRNVIVDGGNGLVTQYWHIVPTVATGQQVVAYETILGHVMRDYGHVHFTEQRDGKPVNPLARGHLAPYDDTTTPAVDEISLRTPRGTEVLPEYVHGRVVLLARAHDTTATPVAPVDPPWANLPVSPALLTWHLDRADGKRMTRERVAFDVRRTLPDNTLFWRYYARGSRQNMASFGGHRSWRQSGVYLYSLTRSPFDSRGIPNGMYRIVVTAADTHGNHASFAQPVIVRNAK